MLYKQTCQQGSAKNFKSVIRHRKRFLIKFYQMCNRPIPYFVYSNNRHGYAVGYMEWRTEIIDRMQTCITCESVCLSHTSSIFIMTLYICKEKVKEITYLNHNRTV